MNQFFSFKRFNLLVLKHWADNKKRYGLSVLAFIGFLIAWFVFIMLIADNNPMREDVQQSIFFLLLFGLGSFFASQYFSDLGSRARGSNFLIVPASAFEKFLCSMLYTVFLFFVAFTAAFYLVDSLMVTIWNRFFEVNETVTQAKVVNVFTTDIFRFNRNATLYLFFFFSVQSAFLLGSIYFRKYSFIKTIICGFIAWFILFSLLSLLLKSNLPGDESFAVMPDGLSQVFRLLVYAVAPILWIIAYFRLKSKQV